MGETLHWIHFFQVDAGNLHDASPLMLAAKGGFEAPGMGWEICRHWMGRGGWGPRARMWLIF